jgi:Protein of unknown function (DUF3122)
MQRQSLTGAGLEWWRWRQWGLVLLLVLGLGLGPALPAQASVHTYHERPGQTTYRSQQSLRDQRDRAWQATVFKRYQGPELQGVYLRLVSFPGSVTIDPSRPLQIDTGTGQRWQAPPELDPQTAQLPAGVGQYSMAALLPVLTRPIALKLSVPLQRGGPAQLTAAPFVVDEWRALQALGPEPS